MLTILFELFNIVICSLPLLFNNMNILKHSLFYSSNKRNSKLSSQNQLKKYKFRQENNSLTDPLLSTDENNDTKLGTIDSDEELQSNNKCVIRTRQSPKNLTLAAHSGGSIVIVEKSILPNETIQAFAIRYRVSISQLKRLNNFQNDQDFYALTYCRVPVRRFGLLHDSSSSSSTIVNLNEQSTISLPITHLSQQNHHAFLNAMDKDLASMRTKVEQLIDTPSTTSFSNQLISQSLTKHMIKSGRNTTNELNCDGADCGCRIWHIILILILMILIPSIYSYFYIKSHSNNKL